MRWWWRGTRARVAAGISALVVVWVLLAPRAFGGGVDYLILSGNSMAPRFVRGDLVLVRPAPFYQVGDVVAYRHPEVGPVFHRIIAQEGEHFVLQGDHNTWVDGYRPTAAEILGKLWWHVPGLGRVILALRTPAALAALSGLFVFLVGATLMTPSSASSSRARLRRQARRALTALSSGVAAHAEGYLIGLYLLGFLALILGAFAFTRPLTLQASEAIPYTQQGAFAYTAPLRASGVYDADHVPSGGAIFPHLSCTVTLTFAYRLESAVPFEGGGSYRLQAEVAAPNGWMRVFPLQDEGRFNGNAFQTQADLNVCLLEDLLRQTEAITGVQPFQYTLALTPNVRVLGALGGQPLQATFAPALTFTVERQQIYLRREGGSEQDPLAPRREGQVTRPVSLPNTLPIFGLALPVGLARGIAAAGLGLTLFGLLLLYGVEAWTTRQAPPLAARLRAGGQVVEIDRPLTLVHPARMVRVKQHADLLRLAEKTAQPLFLYADAAYLEYYLRADETLYVYREVPLTALTAAEVQHALEEGQFVLYYQPGIALEDGRITHLEALLRWRHPARGLLTAAAFWPQIEATGSAADVDRWVLDQVGAHLRTWEGAGSPPYPVAVNLALATLQTPGWAEAVHQQVLAAGLSPSRLIFEIPPDAPLEDPGVAHTLRTLHEAGFGIALNAVSDVEVPAWQALPGVEVVKLGYPALQRLASTANAAEALGRWIAAAHQAHTHVAVVGVETLQQLRLFRAQACDRAQGYLISPPLAAEDVPLFLARRESLLDPLWLEVR
ncbi:EAL domain-containing protein [uncultured Thermanaerothrix sp.]|uniref:EAL domain-containing protein n=1 Tax=uncultured Thermanaerothrix sp. TaxID=1195149 RepID=UPI00262ED467|nr:EAL domain-containing protein [uncultured Thermanaerothrix sp.]